MRARTWVVALVGLALAVELAIALLASHRPADGAASSATVRGPTALAAGSTVDKPVGRLPLVDEHGHPTSLGAFRGRFLVLAPSLTLCHEVCPLTTGALMRLKAMLRASGLQHRVAVAEATVDPWRDSPARVRAFRRRTGTNVRFLTGDRAQIHRLWKAFGVAYKRVPQGHPPDVDWWTHKPERFDVEHTDGVFIVDPRGRWRVAVPGMPDVGRLSSRLASLLNDQGRANMRAPDMPWTSAQLLDDLHQLMGRPVTRTPAGTAAPSPGTQAGGLRAGGRAAFQAHLAALRGHPVVVTEWASWCPPCRQELPLLAAAAARHRGRVGFVGLNVNDDPTGARRLLAQHPLPYPTFADRDGGAARSLSHSEGLPTTVYLDASGQVSFVHMGQYGDAASLAGDIAAHALRGTG